MPALKIAAEYNVRLLVKNGGLVDMRQRPIVVAVVDEIIEGAGRIVCMASHAAETCVKHADIEEATNWRWITWHEIIDDIALPKTLAMQCDSKFLQAERLRFSRGEYV